MRDNWCVGYSRRYTVGVWVGNFAGEPMRNVSGVTGAAPVWTEVMAWLHGAVPSAPPAAPAGVVAARVAFPGAVEPARLEWFLAGTEPPSAAPAIAGGHPRIIAPVSGTIIALDPDIPEGRERLVFEATDARESLRWVLDGDDLGPARELARLAPRPRPARVGAGRRPRARGGPRELRRARRSAGRARRAGAIEVWFQLCSNLAALVGVAVDAKRQGALDAVTSLSALPLTLVR